MKALFVYTAKVFQSKEHFHTNNLPARIWQDRYLRIFDSVTVYARRIKDDYCKEAVSDTDGVEFKLTDIGVSPKELILKRNSLYKEIRELAENVDFIVARMGFFGVIAAKVARDLKKPYCCEVVGSSWDDLWNYSWVGKLAALYLQPQVKNEVSLAPFAVYVTNEYLQKEYPCKGITVGISNVILQPHNDTTLIKRLRYIEGKAEGSPILLGTAAGIDVPYKGQRFVIEAIKELNKCGIRCEYHLAGNGDQAYLRNFAIQCGVENQVVFSGVFPHQEMYKYFDELDIYVQPSLQEGLPRAMIEAMGRGLPAIGARTAGIPELVESQFVCKRKSVKDIVDKVLMFATNKELMKKQAKRNFIKSFEYEKQVLEDRWYDFYLQATCKK